jgi:Haem-binding domain
VLLRARSRIIPRAVRMSAVLAVVVAFASTIHPYGVMKRPQPQSYALRFVETDSTVAAILTRSCVNCHSDSTAWPWYSYVPPASWLVERDVTQARKHFNLSRWPRYSREEKVEILTDIARVVANREMPLPQYLMLHKEARLSDQDAHAVVSWAGKQRRMWRNSSESAQKASRREGVQ